MKRLFLLWMAVAALGAAPAFSGGGGPAVRAPAGAAQEARKPAPRLYSASGTVTRLAPELGAVMIEHGPVPELNWPAMNMTFGVDRALLDEIGEGDTLDFSFVKSGDEYLITAVGR